MRIVTLIALLAMSGFAALADAAKEPGYPQESSHSIFEKSSTEISAKKDASVVRTHSGFRNVSEIKGRG